MQSIGQDQNFVVLNLQCSSVDFQISDIFLRIHDFDSAFFQGCNHGSMVVHDLKRSRFAGQLHQSNFGIEESGFGGNDFQVHGWQIKEALLFGFHHFLTLFYGFFYGSHQVECCFGVFIHFAVEDHLKALDGIFDGYEGAGDARELCGNVEGL